MGKGGRIKPLAFIFFGKRYKMKFIQNTRKEFIFMKFLLFTVIAIFAFSFTVFAQVEQQNDRDQGIELYRQGEYENAVETLQARVKAEAKDRLAWLYLGASYVKLKRNKEADKAFNKMKGVYKENPPVYDKKLKIISKPYVQYTDEARQNGIRGTISLAVEFGADGKIGFVFPFHQLPYGLTENAVKAAGTIKFEPAEKDGKPLTVVHVIEYSFTTY